MRSVPHTFAIGLAGTLACLASFAQSLPPSTLIHPVFTTEAGAKSYQPISLARSITLRIGSAVLPKDMNDERGRQILGIGRMLTAENYPSLDWQVLADGRLRAVAIVESPGALQLRVGLRLGPGTEGSEIRMAPASNPALVESLLPDQVRTGAGASVVWTNMTAGDAQAVEITTADSAASQIDIVGISYVFQAAGGHGAKAIGGSLSCQVDVACVSTSPTLDSATKAIFNNKVNSTALLVITDSTGLTTSCTGTLLSNDYNVAVLHTANHCIGTSVEANSLVTAWNYQATSCNGQVGAYTVRQGGSIELAFGPSQDQSLVAMREAPPAGAVLSGWNAAPTLGPNELMLGTHHPQADLKKVSIGNITGVSGPFSVGGMNFPANTFYTTTWQIGLVEPGSSGSGLFYEPPGAGYLALIGALNSGPSTSLSCAAASTYTNRYGMFSAFFPQNRRFFQSSYSINFTDLWWNPAESGWGINLQHQGDTLFATWFTYDLDGKGMWLVMSAGERVGSSYTFTGALYRPRGTPFNLINGAPAIDTPLQQVGSATLTFASANAGTFTYNVNGVTQSKTIQRQVFSTPASCRFNMADRSKAANFQDLWWNPNESGWGINITHQGSTLFATWFTYDSTRAAMWLVMSNGVQIGPNTFRGDLYRTSGTPFSAINGQQAINLPLTPIGTLTLTFTDGLNGTMTYSVNGISGSKSIRRQLFRYPNTVCS